MASKFYYFGFGSNLLAKRLHLQNPTAIRMGPGKLENYRLDFYFPSKRWNGAAATIVPTKDDFVWGAVWEIDGCDMKHLDEQEGVDSGIYTPISVSVYCSSLNKSLDCRAYHLCDQPATNLKNMSADEVPMERQPSLTYLKTLVKGALETGIPSDYVEWLKKVKHNTKSADYFEKELELDKIKLN
ncbi:gamma-glutamylcyclotransferase [Stomoxys calcitrans]|uniref:gamma-glutamylcyclotransferase n=1 Tax=Stomoxys calcitrans TaxID=35570 RepID=A0A1I8Q5R1_STOCA|nr:gamma-glutamylcyclotransferase [Stomoxys calcitrans]XP_013116746.1 gamma-glutamylcyclotransferase [Stomoxys calcitrans]